MSKSKMNPVVHFEMPYEKQGRLTKFYKEVFGWKMEAMGESMGNYVVATTADSDVKPDIPRGAIGGGFFPKKSDWPAQVTSVVIGVEDIEQFMKKVKKAGGAVLGKPIEIPGVGQFISITDTEGNRVSLIQPSEMAQTSKPSPPQKKKSHTILHDIGIKASAKTIYEALTDTKKLAKWWTSDTRGRGSKIGETLEFWFGDFCQKFEVIELKPNRLVRWRADKKVGMPEWSGTEIEFSLSPEKGQCHVLFSHSNWDHINGMFPHCSTKWAVFMLSLKNLLEKGKGQPVPRDVEINHD